MKDYYTVDEIYGYEKPGLRITEIDVLDLGDVKPKPVIAIDSAIALSVDQIVIDPECYLNSRIHARAFLVFMDNVPARFVFATRELHKDPRLILGSAHWCTLKKVEII